MKDNKNRNKIIGISIGILVVLLVVVSSTYAYWQITKSQSDSNDIIAACLDISYTNESGTFGIDPAWPISDSEGMNLTGYSFTVTNNCEQDINYIIGMDSLEVSGASYLSYDSIKVSLDNTPAIIYGEQEEIGHIEENDSYTVRDSKKINTAVVKNGTPNTHNVKVWIKSDAPVEEQSKVFSGRMFITGGQNIENDKPIAELIATGDMSKTENDNVTYKLYDNGSLIISGAGAIKDYSENGLLLELFTKYFEHYGIVLNEGEQAIANSPSLFGYFGLAWYGKPFYLDFQTDGAFKTSEDVINYVKNNTEYGDAFESLLEKSSKFKYRNVIVEEGITSIGEYALSSILADNVYISDSVIELKDRACLGMAVAQELKLSDNLKVIGEYAFYKMALKSKTLYIPNSVETTVNNIFLFNSNIEIIRLPENEVFNHMSSNIYSSSKINTIIIPETIKTFSSMTDDNKEASITLKFEGPERTIYLGKGDSSTEYDLSVFKEVIWNYTE